MAPWIADTLRSVAGQTFQDYFEWIIIDNASTDGTMDVVRDLLVEYPALDDRTSLHYNEQDIGGRASRNMGVRYASGRYTLMLDADDTIEPTMIEECLPWLESGEFDIVAVNQHTFGAQDYIFDCYGYPFADILQRNVIPACSLVRKRLYCGPGTCIDLVTREAYRGVGVYNTEALYEDWEWWARAYLAGARLKRLNRVLFNYRHRPGQASSTIDYETGRRQVQATVARLQGERLRAGA